MKFESIFKAHLSKNGTNKKKKKSDGAPCYTHFCFKAIHIVAKTAKFLRAV